MTQDRPYGAWESPISSQSITTGSIRLGGGLFVVSKKDDDVKDNKMEQLYWLEGRPQEGGRNVLCRFEKNDAVKKDITPSTTNVRTRVHEYGGGALTMNQDGSTIVFSEFTTQQLCRLQAENGHLQPITTPDDDTARYRFADGVLDSTAEILYCVREDHTQPEPQNVVNEIVAVNMNVRDGSSTVTTIATGNDFYAAPRLSPDGTQLAYVTWNHPNMPWDATELRIVTIGGDGGASKRTEDHTLVAGHDGDTSILQPLWHPTQQQPNALYYISDQSGYYSIYRMGTNDPVVQPREDSVDFGGNAPGWTLGQQGFTFLQNGKLVATHKNRQGQSVLVVADVDGDAAQGNVQEYSVNDGLPIQFGNIVASCNSNNLYCIGGSPSKPASIYRWNIDTMGPAEQLYSSSSLSFPQTVISIPRQVEFPTKNGRTAFAYYYAPYNADFQCTTESAGPPLLVKAHGGPTACTGTLLNPTIQYFTSRGFAVLDVDYGGSTGYGREYRRRLRKSWGVVDIDDVCNGALHMVRGGFADGQRLCIDGGSAGGYTTLGALAFRSVFAAGCSLYGVGDLSALAGDTHKFESRYLDGLVGPYPEDKAIYKQRSPIESVDTLNCPILLLQGDEDKIVPPNQARMMHEALLKKGIPCCLKMYKGEQHGFRKAENIEDALDSELAFYGKVFDIDVPGAVELDIDNL